VSKFFFAKLSERRLKGGKANMDVCGSERMVVNGDFQEENRQ